MTHRTFAILIATLTLSTLPLSTIRVSASAQTQEPISSTRSFRQILRRLFPDDERKDPPTTSRGELCLLSPALPDREVAIWHRQPVFVWQGTIGKMSLVDAQTNATLWTYEPAEGETSVRYEGVPLRANRSYRWQVFQTNTSDSPVLFPSFQVLPEVNRLLIANGLSVAESYAENTDSWRRLARADYFVSRRLPTDAIQSLFLVENPGDEFIAARQEAVDTLCE